jgi:hypothetical protein
MTGLAVRLWGFGIVPALLVGLTAIGCSSRTDDDSQANSKLGERADDATGVGPLQVTSAEYKFDPAVDPDVLSDRPTELWARVWRPTGETATRKHPLLVFQHGNHGTCGTGTNPRVDSSSQYTMSGTCPAGYVVTPNHMGYAYLAERLASWGYIVVSVNANRGITAGGGVAGDGGLNLARGKLILRHLQKLSEWNANAGTTPASLGVDLAGQIDFDNVGMMGHSRGGEGVRAAYVQYNDAGSPWPARILAPLNVKAIFEIGPVDGQTGRTLNAFGTAWNVILPMCDGDVSNLQGMKPFDRMTTGNTETNGTPKGMFGVWGANHNYFNTEWQTSDSRGCTGTGHQAIFNTSEIGSAKQRTAALHAMMGFFRAHVGKEAAGSFNNAFDPKFGVPEALESVTRIQRAYADAADGSHVLALENFSKPAGTSLAGQPTVATNVTVTHGSASGEHDPALKAAKVVWTGGSAQSVFEVPWAAQGAGVDASGFETFDFRVSRVENASATTVADGPLNFSVQLVNADGSVSSPVKLGSYVEVLGNGGHVVMDTARIPVADFAGANLAKVRGVRFVFDQTAQGSALITSVRFSKAVAPNKSPAQAGNFAAADADGQARGTISVTTGNQINEVRRNAANGVEVEVASATEFFVADELPRLRIGQNDTIIARYPDDGDTHRMVFTLTQQEFDAVQDGAPVTVRYGEDVANIEWHFGNFQKGSVR